MGRTGPASGGDVGQPLQAEDPAVIGSFRLTARLGEGGMGRVYLGESGSGRQVAVKVIRPEIAQDPGFRQRFRREVDLAMKAGGFWTAPVVDADPDAPSPWVASQYVPGPPLDEYITEHGPLDEPALRRLGAGLAEALTAFHRIGLVHRDLKPSNILLLDDGPRVVDFGISKALETEGASGLTATGTVIGTPGFMSPEQALGNAVGPPTDVFSLGAVLAFAATGRAPFGYGAAHALLFRVVHEPPQLEGVPEALLDTVLACLDKSAAARPRAEELAEILTNGRGTPPARPVDVPPPPRTAARAALIPTEVPRSGSASGQNPTASAPRPAQVPPMPAPAPPAVPGSAAADFATEDGGLAVFGKRLRKPTFWSLAIIAATTTPLVAAGEAAAGLFLAGLVFVVGLLPRLIGGLPLLVHASLRADARALTMRLGKSELRVPWQDLAHVSFTREGFSLRLMVLLRSDSQVRVPAPLRRPGSGDPHEAEYLLISWRDTEARSRAARLHSVLAMRAGAAYPQGPEKFS